MKNIKKVIIMLVILIIIIICILMLLKKVNDKSSVAEGKYTPDVTLGDTLEQVTIRNNYFTVKNIVDEYYYSLCKLNKTSDDILIFEYDKEVEHLEKEFSEEIENNKKRIYNFFDEDYIEETGLSTNNLQKKLGNYNDVYVLIDDMYVRDITEFLKVYFVFGTLTEKDTLKKENFKLMLALYSNNSTFNLYTGDYIDKHNLYELSKNKNFSEKVFDIRQIEDRKYNKYEYKMIDDETYAKELLKSYTQSVKYNNIDYSYNKLDEDYKTKRFKKESDYEEYINENKKSIITATLKYYKDNKYKNYRQHVCIDQSGKYYIFNETSIMNYSLILDTYTIDLPEFLDRYKSATVQEKVSLNIQKVIEALNAKDYNYIYGKLADEFKENYFKTYEDFEKYASKTFDIENKITFDKYTESENLSTYKIIMEGKNKTTTKTIVMRLDKGTNFVMSFNVN